MARTLKESVEIAANCVITSEHPIMAWIVDHAATLLNLFKRTHGGDGLTAVWKTCVVQAEESNEDEKQMQTWSVCRHDNCRQNVFNGVGGRAHTDECRR